MYLSSLEARQATSQILRKIILFMKGVSKLKIKTTFYYHLLVLSIPNPFFPVPNFAFIQKIPSSSTNSHSNNPFISSPIQCRSFSFYPCFILFLYYPVNSDTLCSSATRMYVNVFQVPVLTKDFSLKLILCFVQKTQHKNLFNSEGHLTIYLLQII